MAGIYAVFTILGNKLGKSFAVHFLDPTISGVSLEVFATVEVKHKQGSLLSTAQCQLTL